MGAKHSSDARPRTYSNAGEAGGITSNGAGGLVVPGTSGGISQRGRTRSLGSVTQNNSHGRPLSIPSSNGAPLGSGSPDSEASTPEEGGGPLSGLTRGFLQHSSLPVHLFALHSK